MNQIASFWVGHAGRFCLALAARRTIVQPAGVRALVEEARLADLASYLAAVDGQALAAKLAVDENAISRLRAAVGAPLAHGGARRNLQRTADPDRTPLTGLGEGRNRVLLCVAQRLRLLLVPGTAIVVELRTLPALATYTANQTLAQIAEEMAIGKHQALTLRRWCEDRMEALDVQSTDA